MGAACLERGQKDGVKAPRQPRSEARGGACKRGGEGVKQGSLLQGAGRRAALQPLMDRVCCQQAGKTVQETEEGPSQENWE